MQAFVTLSTLTPRLVVSEDYGQKHEDRHSLRGALPSVLRLFGLRWSRARPTREQALGWLNVCKMDELCFLLFFFLCPVWCGARMDPDRGASLIHVVSSSLCSTLLFFTILYSTSRHVTSWYITCSALLKTTRLHFFSPVLSFFCDFSMFFFFFFLFFPDSAIAPPILTSCSSHTEACNALVATEGITSLTTITCTLTTTTCTL